MTRTAAQQVKKETPGPTSATGRLARQRKAFVPVHPTPCGKFTLIAKVGHGGMAEVFLSVTTGIGGFRKLSVVKRIHPQLLEEPDFVDMFLDEARLAARLSHPNVVQTHEVGDHEGVPFIAMEYMEGQPYDKLLKTLRRHAEQIPMKLAARVAIDSLAGLHYAHKLTDYDGTSLGVVHRDISPSNIFITYQGTVKILDFGIAKATTKLSETRTGQIKGKLSYMAPEQARGKAVDGRADVWSIGVTLFESCTGTRLFKGESDVDTLQRVLTGDIHSLVTESSLPEPLLAVIEKSLARRREDRFTDAQDMKRALEAIIAELPGPDPDMADFLAEHFGELAASQRETLGDLLSQVDRLMEAQGSAADEPIISTGDSVAPPATAAARANSTDNRLQLVLLMVLVVMGLAGGVYVALGGPQPVAVPPPVAAPAPVRPSTAGPEPAPEPDSVVVAPPNAPRAVAPEATPEATPEETPEETPRRPRRRRRATSPQQPARPTPPPEQRPAHPAATGTGTLRLVTRPYSEVYIGGRRIGVTPLLGHELPAGSHTLVLRNPEENIEQRITVQIRAGETRRLSMTLE